MYNYENEQIFSNFLIFVFISNKFSSQELEGTFDDDVIDFAIPGEAGLSEEEKNNECATSQHSELLNL